MLERISEVNRLHPGLPEMVNGLPSMANRRPEVVRYAIYRVFVFLYQGYRSHRQKKKGELRENVIDYLANLADRIHCQMPSLRLKELLIGHAVFNFRFLLPEAPPQG